MKTQLDTSIINQQERQQIKGASRKKGEWSDLEEVWQLDVSELKALSGGHVLMIGVDGTNLSRTIR